MMYLRNRRTGLGRLAVVTAFIAASIAATGCGSSSGGSDDAGANAAAAGCTPKHPGFKTIKAGELRVVGVAYPPAIFAKGGVPYGTDGDLIKAIAKMECLKVKFTTVDSAGAVASVTSHRADVLVGDWWRTKSRMKIVNVTVPIYLDPFVIMSRGNIAKLDELKGKKVGDLQGTTWNKALKKIVGSGYRLYQTQDQLNQDVANGRLDAGTTTYMNFGPLAKSGKFDGIKASQPQPDARIEATQNPGQSTFIYAKGADELGKALDDDLAALRQDGTLAKIMERYGLPVSLLKTGKPSYV